MVSVQIGVAKEKPFKYSLNSLTRHAAVVGTTGSGKTVMGKVLLEEVLARGIPVIAIDPKGDVGGLAIADKGFDFRPFVGNTLPKATKIAQKYVDMLVSQRVDTKNAQKLGDITTTIYTPKSTVGKAVSLLPRLDAPKNFAKLTKDDPHMVADFVEPISESILQLAGVKGSARDKFQAFISAILLDQWEKQKSLDLEKLLELVSNPPFEELGSLPLEEFVNEKERKKLAAALNVLLSSPAKKVWRHGESLSIASMLKPKTLSVFDLRHARGQEEKQFVVEQILQNLYKYLVQKGGTQKLRYVLYIDELAGLLPAPPANPPSKKLLELLIRQARAFGLGIIVATQSPGDIDYRIFGNIGSRFIGKLRTHNDIEKVATAMNESPSVLREKIGSLKTGDFMFNNAIKNSTKKIHARWLFTYHDAPLSAKQIEWVNSPSSRPASKESVKVKASLKKEKKKKVLLKKKTVTKLVSAEQVVRSVSPKKSTKKVKTESTDSMLKKLIRDVKKHADSVQLKIAATHAQEYVPHLRVVVETKGPTGLKFDLQGPFVFDLTTKSIPLGNYLQGVTLRSYIPQSVSVEKPKRNIDHSIKYALREARDCVKTKYYESTVVSFVSKDRNEVEEKNHLYLRDQMRGRLRQIKQREERDLKKVDDKITSNRKAISSSRTRLSAVKRKRFVKRVFKGRTLQGKTKEMKEIEKRIEKLNKDVTRLQEKKRKIRKQYDQKAQAVKERAFIKAHQFVKERSFTPTRKNHTVHAVIILMPKRKIKV